MSAVVRSAQQRRRVLLGTPSSRCTAEGQRNRVDKDSATLLLLLLILILIA